MTGEGPPLAAAGYERPPWEIGAPQPALQQLANIGALKGRVLDVGCGTGEHTLMAATAGLDATGIDRDPGAVEVAARKARERGLTARFIHLDALCLAELDEVFDTALDSLFLHALTTTDRSNYLDGFGRSCDQEPNYSSSATATDIAPLRSHRT